MRPTAVKLGPFSAASATRFRAAATIGGAGALTLLTTTVDAKGTARRILFTFVSDESAVTFTIVGADWNGQSQTEVVTGSASTSSSTFDFLTLTSITASAASTGNVSIGTSGVASTRPIILDPYADPSISIQVACSGTTQSYSVEFCAQDPNLLVQGFTSSDPQAVTWPNLTWVAAISALSAKTAGAMATQTGVYKMARLTASNAGTSTTDYATGIFTQALNAPY